MRSASRQGAATTEERPSARASGSGLIPRSTALLRRRILPGRILRDEDTTSLNSELCFRCCSISLVQIQCTLDITWVGLMDLNITEISCPLP
jgi:hypothetical protein